MNALASECRSDCESGWTLYLEKSLLSQDKAYDKFVNSRSSGFCGKGTNIKEQNEIVVVDEEGEEDEDLSMVSDASSGPPHFLEDEGCFNYENVYFCSALKDNTTTTLPKTGGRRQKKKDHNSRQVNEGLPSCLDDTASSPAFNFSKNNFAFNSKPTSMESVLDYSQGFSATHFQKVLGGRSAYQDHHFGYAQPAPSGNQFHN
ncbi:hypothetical protein K2173_002285 [Erythroxylum novogranatense]|uniref:Uncharacterized protein n=1 Tax=Erythroxylum novogranatense TaxID=1862640 RepID=A0AAV8T9B2_9ROSI|nr:hypothetical protein K2173_002285 [Erythroxylum novogranatense]